MPETEQRNINPAALPDFHTSSEDNVLFCPLSVRYRLSALVHGDFRKWEVATVLKYNGGDSGIKISVLYWRCSLIRVSVIRGSFVFFYPTLSECRKSTAFCNISRLLAFVT
jgi:hypothetical protein